jgi:hypothetical protein
MNKILENFAKLSEKSTDFDISFWQSQEPALIFDAVQEMLMDYLLVRGTDADESRLQRTVEYFHRP